jgi:choline dehydrogenase-like flavoprotein
MLTQRCAMGVSPSVSVVDPRGAIWDTSNLFVADAVSHLSRSCRIEADVQSVFPSASGVNPMVTTMACAYSVAGFMLEDLRRQSTQEYPVQARL